MGTADDELFQTTSTASDGSYLFDSIVPNDYYIAFDNPNSSHIITEDSVSNGSTNSDITGSNGAGTTNTFTLSSGENELDIDAGYYEYAVIGDQVWLDTDGDGTQDSGENGIQGVTVELYSAGPDGIMGTIDDVLNQSTATDTDGE